MGKFKTFVANVNTLVAEKLGEEQVEDVKVAKEAKEKSERLSKVTASIKSGAKKAGNKVVHTDLSDVALGTLNGINKVSEKVQAKVAERKEAKSEELNDKATQALSDSLVK